MDELYEEYIMTYTKENLELHFIGLEGDYPYVFIKNEESNM